MYAARVSPDDTRLLVVLFTDIVGSTATRRILGDELADTVLREQDEALRRHVETQGGTYVKNLGDGLMATFRGASAAVDAGMHLQREVCTMRSMRGVFPIRTGIAAGDVLVHSDGDVFGTPVVEASRLCAQARSGQILCSATMRTLVGSRSLVPFRDIGSLSLKGMAEPVPTLEVDWLLGLGSDAWLVVHQHDAPRLVELTHAQSIRLGTADGCEVVILSERSVSRTHCELQRRGNDWWVVDLGSRNGTYVNGVLVDGEHVLTDGDSLQLGAVDVDYHSPTPITARSETEVYARNPTGGVGPETVALLELLCRPLVDGDVLSEPSSVEDIAKESGRSRDAVEAALFDAATALDVPPGSWHQLAQAALLRGVIG